MPICSHPSITAAGGAAPAIRPLIGCRMPARNSSGALISMLYTIGAPHRCVTVCSRISSKTWAGSTFRRHTLVPAFSASVHGKHQPLQWNIGSVHRYTACCGMPQEITLLTAFK